jgi:DnaJ family protein C protein 11
MTVYLPFVQSQLPGFFDPCVGEEKSLLVQYLFHSHVHEVVIQDTEPLRIPKQCKYLM